jgi:hypothetical protein
MSHQCFGVEVFTTHQSAALKSWFDRAINLAMFVYTDLSFNPVGA